MPRKGRKRKKTRTHVVEDYTAQSALASSETSKVPKSVVVSMLVPQLLRICQERIRVPSKPTRYKPAYFIDVFFPFLLYCIDPKGENRI